MQKLKPLFWAGVFTLCFVLALDYWRWDAPVELCWLGFPSWMQYFIVIQVLLTILIGLFAKYGWKEDAKKGYND